MSRRRRQRSWRPFEEEEPQRHTVSKPIIRAVIILFLLYFLFKYFAPPPVDYTPQGKLINEFFDSQNVKNLGIEIGDSASDRRFLASLIPRPERLPKSGKQIMDSTVAKRISEAEKKRYAKLEGLTFCNILNGAVIDTLVHINAWGMTVGEKNPDLNELVELIDGTARNVYEFIFSAYYDVDPDEAQKFACFSAGEGANSLANISTTKLFMSLDTTHYFSKELPSIKKQESIIKGPRRSYKLAYLILVNDPSGLDQLEMLLEILNDGSAIILIHVDAKQEILYNKIQQYIIQKENGQQGHIYLAETRYRSILGHISLLYCYLSSYFQLRDLADWDYVINLSNFDWPLRRNDEIHRILNIHKGASYIDFWSSTENLAKRTMRPHLGNSVHHTNYHSPELGISGWPFVFWQSFIQQQWMILSADAVDHFRTDKVALNYLAQMEHVFMPEEQFFATVLSNSPKHRSKLIADKKRLVREGNKKWIDWDDRNLFPPGSKNPSYLFIRPFNALGSFVGDTKLKDWIRKYHLDPSAKAACKLEELGMRDECLFELLKPISVANEIIVFPVNKSMLKVAANLYCSLIRNNIKNVVFWALDLEAHEVLLEKNHASYFISEWIGSPESLTSDSEKLTRMLRFKPELILKFVNAGFNVWYLDADSVVLREFSSRSKEYTDGNIEADILLGLRGLEQIDAALPIETPPEIQAGIMYFKSNERTTVFLKGVINVLETDPKMNDLTAIINLISKPHGIKFTGIGSRTISENYPNAVDVGSRVEVEQDAEPKPISAQIVDFFSFGSHDKSTVVRIHFLDQYEFISGELYFNNEQKLPDNYQSFRIIHASGLKNPEELFKKRNLWFLDVNDVCTDSVARPGEKKGNKKE